MGVLAVAGQKVPASFPNQYYGFADTTGTTVTAATQTALTTPYTIPANEAAVGSAYEIIFGGNGVWGATQQALNFNLVVGSVVVTTNNATLGAQAFSASAAFRFAGRVQIVFNAVGASGNALGAIMINLAETLNNIAPPATVTQANLQANASYGFVDASSGPSAAIDTTAAQAAVLKCAWAATTGAPTITNRHTIFRKIA